MNDDVFTLKAVVLAAPDTPGFATPMFRDSFGKHFYVQSANARGSVEEFIFVGSAGHQICRPALSNTGYRVGDNEEFALVDARSELIIGGKSTIISHFFENFAEFTQFPFLFYQLALFARHEGAVMDAFGMPQIQDAIIRREITVRFPFGNGKWTQNNENVLRMLWKYGYSASEIGRCIGKNRNTVVGKAHRMNLPGRATSGGVYKGGPNVKVDDPGKYDISIVAPSKYV